MLTIPFAGSQSEAIAAIREVVPDTPIPFFKDQSVPKQQFAASLIAGTLYIQLDSGVAHLEEEVVEAIGSLPSPPSP